MTFLIEFILYFFIFYTGASVFSFLNVVVYRLPLGLQFVKGRSFCPKCNHTLSPIDLFPIFSYIVLGGKCRYCKEKVSFRYTFAEIIGGICAISVYFVYGFVINALTAFLFLCMMFLVSFVDWDTMEIPNEFIIFGAIVALMSYFFPAIYAGNLVSRLIGAVIISVPMFLLALIIEGAFGGGDMKLMFVCGFFFGWKLTLVSMFAALIFGSVYAVFLMVKRKKKGNDLFAFGPFLCMGMTLCLFVGEKLLTFYLGLFNF